VFDIDDLILNLLGVTAGVLVYGLMSLIPGLRIAMNRIAEKGKS
jgi:hypothetical protein